MTDHFIGIDLGASGARACLVRSEPDGATSVLRRAESSVPGRVDATGVRADHLRGRMTALLADLLTSRDAGIVAVAVGCAGLVHQGEHLYELVPGWITQACSAQLVVVCSDMLTAYLGGLGFRPGVVVAAGTGAVAVGSDMAGRWRRVDGWGYSIGDLGGGAWIGRCGLEAGVRAFDGRPGGSDTLLARLVGRFGSPVHAAGELARRDDRAAVMAAFAPDVVEVAEEGDEVAVRIVAQAGVHLAESAVAALFPAGRVIVPMGGLLATAGRLRDEFVGALRRLAPGVEVGEPLGQGSDGAGLLASSTWRHRVLPPGADQLGARLFHTGPGRTAATP